MNTLELRVARGNANAAALADFLAGQPAVRRVFYPGRADHPDHAVAKRLFGDQFGNMLFAGLGVDHCDRVQAGEPLARTGSRS